MTGLCYEEGIHRPADLTAAVQWFQKAAQTGHLNSYCYLGNLLMTGNGIAKNPLQALELCRPAAMQGSIPAQIRQLFEQAAALKYILAYFQVDKHFFTAKLDAATNLFSTEHLTKAYLCNTVIHGCARVGRKPPAWQTEGYVPYTAGLDHLLYHHVVLTTTTESQSLFSQEMHHDRHQLR